MNPLTTTPDLENSAISYPNSPARKQNWVLSPAQDGLLIIIAPVITLIAALYVMHAYGSVKGATLILISHVIFTVAHHLPTFIRVYGDVELFRRFNWHFVFAPLISLIGCFSVLTYMIMKGYGLENFMYLYILLTLWDPWHFMRQHFGFMRIYDRVSSAPAKLASRMDLMLSISWFAFILVASGDWMFDLLQDMYSRTQWPLLMMLTRDGVHAFTGALRLLALMVSAAYLAYVFWCWNKRYAVSIAKLLMCITTFGVMYLTYTPNAIIQSLAPGWSFKVGFAVIGIVHMTQYLAIVWRYNRKLAGNNGRARAGIFAWLHSRSTWWAAGVYVAICLAYGNVVTTVHSSAWLMASMLAIGFTSTMMHYYFDGFIWKIRHTQNEQMLVSTAASRSADTEAHSTSWNVATASTSPLRILAKQLVYFALPMAILTVASLPTWSRSSDSYITHMYRAQELNQQGLENEAEHEARTAFALMQEKLPQMAKMVELDPTGARHAELAFLIYNESMYENLVIPQLDGLAADSSRIEHHRDAIQQALSQMIKAIDSGESLAHVGRENFGLSDAQHVLISWQKQVG